MKIKEILKRITGFSTPVFGISWNPDNTERDHAREVIAYLEDRRVLYNPNEFEIPEHCVDSVIQIRAFLTKKIGELGQDSELSISLRAMRAACRKLLDRMYPGIDLIQFRAGPDHYQRWALHIFIGELRAVFGFHIARIAVVYGIDIESDLASIIPESDVDETFLSKGNEKPPHRKLRSKKKNHNAT